MKGSGKYKRYYLPTVIAHKMQFEAMAPTHGSFAIGGNYPWLELNQLT